MEQIKNGTIEIGLPNERYKGVTGLSYQKTKERQYSTLYMIYKSGRVNTPHTRQAPLLVLAPLKTLKDYEKCFDFVLEREEKVLLNEIERWKNHLITKPEDIVKVPHRVMKYINKKLASLTGLGAL